MNAMGLVADNGDAMTLQREPNGEIVFGAYNERSGAMISLRLPAAEVARMQAFCAASAPARASSPRAPAAADPARAPSFARGLFAGARRRSLATN